MASHCFGHLGAVRRPQSRRFLDVGEPERHGSGRSAERCGVGRATGAELRVLAEDQRLQLAEPRTRFDPERLDEVVTGAAVGGERVGLTADPVQRGHQQRPQALAERVGRGELRQCADDGVGVALDASPEVGLDRAEVLLDEPVDGCRHRLGVEPGEWRAGPLGERGRRVTLAERPLEANGVDRRWPARPSGRRRPVRTIECGPSRLRRRVTYDWSVLSAVRGGCSPHTSATMRETGTAAPGDRARTASTAWHFGGPTSTASPSSAVAATPPRS